MIQVAGALRIGIVDDDASVGRALARLLRQHGYDCLVFPSGEVALAAVELRQMDCLIVDIQLGGMDGFEFNGKLESAGVRIPCVFISAYVAAEQSCNPAIPGDQILLLKPVDEDELLASINRATQSRYP